MRTDLSVPYAEKDEAKRLGARWDDARKVWYVENRKDLEPFLKWMPEHLKAPHVPRREQKRRMRRFAQNGLEMPPPGWKGPEWSR